MSNKNIWPYNFYYDIINDGNENTKQEIEDFLNLDKEEAEKRILSAINNINISERDFCIVRMRYYDNATYREIGKRYQIGGTRVRNIIHNTIFLLRRSGCKDILHNTVQKNNFEGIYTYGYYIIYADKLNASRFTLDSSIFNLPISIRSQNVFRMWNNKKIKNLLHHSIDEISRLRGAGTKTINEIISFLESIGIVHGPPAENVSAIPLVLNYYSIDEEKLQYSQFALDTNIRYLPISSKSIRTLWNSIYRIKKIEDLLHYNIDDLSIIGINDIYEIIDFLNSIGIVYDND